MLVITHDLELAAETADRIVVFYAGTNLEEGDSRRFFRQRNVCVTLTARHFIGLCQIMDFLLLQELSPMWKLCRRAVPMVPDALFEEAADRRCLTET